MRKTTEQWRAKAAWKEINNYKGDMDKLSTTADGAASLIQKVGFGQALAFWLAKGSSNSGKHNKDLADILAHWLLKSKGSHELDKSKDGKKLMEHLIELDSRQYRQKTNEALAYLNWIKRFAKAHKKDN